MGEAVVSMCNSTTRGSTNSRTGSGNGSSSAGWFVSIVSGFILGVTSTFFYYKFTSSSVNETKRKEEEEAKRLLASSSTTTTTTTTTSSSTSNITSSTSSVKHQSLRNKFLSNDDDNNDQNNPAIARVTDTNNSTTATIESTTTAAANNNTATNNTTTTAANKEDFVTGLVKQLWPYMNPALSNTIYDTIKPLLKECFPKRPLSSIKLQKVNLGTTPIHIDNVIVHDYTNKNTNNTDNKNTNNTNTNNNNYIQFDMDIIWESNIEIELSADIIGTFGIKSMKLYGRMSFQLKPLNSTSLPCFTGISYSFINTPYLSLNFTGIASTIAEFSILEKKIHNLIIDSLNNILVLPNRMYYNLLNNPIENPLHTFYQPPHGIARITILDGTGFEIEKGTYLRKDDIPDVYCNVSLGGYSSSNNSSSSRSTYGNDIDTSNKQYLTYNNNTRIIQTPIIKDNCNPIWDYTIDFICYAYDQLLTVHAWDYDSHPLDPDDDLSFYNITIRDLLVSKDRTIEKQLGTTNAYIRIKLDSFIPLQTNYYLPNCVGNNNNTKEIEPITKFEKPIPLYGGLITIIIQNAYHIPLPSPKDATTYVKVTTNINTTNDDPNNNNSSSSSSKNSNNKNNKHHHTFTTGICKDGKGYDALNPSYDTIFHIPLDLHTIRTLQEQQQQQQLDNTTTNTNDDLLVLSLMKVVDENNNNDDKNEDICLGSTSISFQSLITKSIMNEKRTIGTNGATMLEFVIMLSGTVQQDGTLLEEDSTTMIDRGQSIRRPTTSSSSSSGSGKTVTTATTTTTTADASSSSSSSKTKKKKKNDKMDNNNTNNTNTSTNIVQSQSNASSTSSTVTTTTSSNKNKKIKIMAIKGRGFKVEKKRLRKDDIPDVYLKIRIIQQQEENDNNNNNTNNDNNKIMIWTTSIEHNTCTPNWNESKILYYNDIYKDIIRIDAYEHNSKNKDDYYGYTSMTINNLLLRGGIMEVELQFNDNDNNTNNNTNTGLYITFGCELET